MLIGATVENIVKANSNHAQKAENREIAMWSLKVRAKGLQRRNIRAVTLCAISLF